MILTQWLIAAVMTAAGLTARADEPSDPPAAPYDVIESAYAPHMDGGDLLAFPMKVRSLAADEYTFWRGSKDLFFLWAKEHCADWLADPAAYTTSHGDLHLGNLGTYAAGGGWGRMAFGAVDFDDSARLPFQLELLQGLVTLELTARQNGIALTADQERDLAASVVEGYGRALEADGTPPRPADDPLVAGLFADGEGRDYAAVLAEYTDGGRFRRVVYNKKGDPKEILRPAADRRDALAAGIAAAVRDSPGLRGRFRYWEEEAIRRSIRDVVQRTRLGSSGSQGLKKYLILMERPLGDYDGDVVLYLKQQIPTASERSAAVPPDPRPPGRRCAEDMAAMTDPDPYLNGWCEVGGESYWVGFKEPWSEELDFKDATDAAGLMGHARAWAAAAGAAHRSAIREGGGKADEISARLTPALTALLRERTDAYLQRLEHDFAAFAADGRVREQGREAEARLAASVREARP